MRATSDRLCKEHGLSVITEHRAYYPKHYAEWEAERKGQPTWRSAIREDVDKAVMASMSFQAFIRSLKDMGYEVKTGVKHIAVRPPGKEQFVRLRSLGDSYTEEAIKQRILKQRAPERPPRTEPSKAVRVRVQGDFRLSKVTWKGLRALYFFYLRKLRGAQRGQQGKTFYLLREDLRHLDAIDAQARFLFRRRIDSAEQLSAFRQYAEKQIEELCSERNALYNEKRRTGILPEHKEQLRAMTSDISAQVKSLRRDIRLCDEIQLRSELIRKAQTELNRLNKELPCKANSRYEITAL